MNKKGIGIIKALKMQHSQIRLSIGHRWLVWVNDCEEWEVWEHKYYQRGSSCICRTQSETEAVKALLEAGNE